MQLVAKTNGAFFRAQSVLEDEIDTAKQAMLADQEGLVFEVMTDIEFMDWLASQ